MAILDRSGRLSWKEPARPCSDEILVEAIVDEKRVLSVQGDALRVMSCEVVGLREEYKEPPGFRIGFSLGIGGIPCANT